MTETVHSVLQQSVLGSDKKGRKKRRRKKPR